MLNQKFVIKLALLTLVVTIAAFLIHYERLSNTIRNVTEDLVFPTLTSQIEAIKRIKIVSALMGKCLLYDPNCMHQQLFPTSFQERIQK